MILLSVNQITKHYGPEPVLAGVNFDIRPGERIALVGPNGAGKTTLLKIITGQEEPDAGTVDQHTSARTGFLEQHPEFDPEQTVLDVAREALSDVMQLAKESEEVAAAMSDADEATRQRLGKRFDDLQHELQRRGGYAIDHQVESVLSGLGFHRDSLQQKVNLLSGGQQNRLLLAKLLLEAPDLLLLDEPSNHLDIEATQWLENYLVESSQALLLVSHDRYFIDKVANRTLELLNGTVDSYPGNFTAYKTQKQERLEVQQRTYNKQRAEIAKMEEFVRKHHHGLKHAQAEDRRKKLERIELVELPREIRTPPMGFPPATRTGDIVLRVEEVAKAYDEQLFENLSFDILRGEKWGIVGPNGCGKTTLLRCLLGEQELDAGKVKFGANVKAGYFDQLLTGLDQNAEAVDAIRPSHKEFVEQERRDLLARFGITGDMVFQKVSSFSGGERNRTALAKLSASDANFLILDEPTNHLDLWARDALEQALQKFDGTVLFVSHDRYFMNQVADHLLVVEPGRFRVIEGNYDTYRHFVQQGFAAGEATSRDAAVTSNKPSKTTTSNNSQNKKTEEKPARRKRKFPYRKVADLETDIATTEAHIEQLHHDLATPEVLRNGDRVKQCTADLEESKAKLEQLYEHLEEAFELN